MKRALLGAIAAIFLLMTSTSHASDYRTCISATVTPTITAVAVSGQMATPINGISRKTGSPPASNCRQVLSLADIIGIILFLALIVTHFCLCRKGVYPESSCMCEPPLWLKKMWSRASRGADSQHS